MLVCTVSLALTGKGHATDKAAILGLAGYRPDDVDPDKADQAFDDIVNNGVMKLAGKREIPFDYETQMVFHYGEELEHPNGMRIYASDQNGIVVYYKTYLSVGGGFVVCADEFNSKDKQNGTDAPVDAAPKVPFPFKTAADLLRLCEQSNMSVAQLVMANEKALAGGDADAVNANIDAIWDVMRNCIDRGLRMEGIFAGQQYEASCFLPCTSN